MHTHTSTCLVLGLRSVGCWAYNRLSCRQSVLNFLVRSANHQERREQTAGRVKCREHPELGTDAAFKRTRERCVVFCSKSERAKSCSYSIIIIWFVKTSDLPHCITLIATVVHTTDTEKKDRNRRFEQSVWLNSLRRSSSRRRSRFSKRCRQH